MVISRRSRLSSPGRVHTAPNRWSTVKSTYGPAISSGSTEKP